jgi:hypothetical protein
MKRIYHPWTVWECYPAGMYSTTAEIGSEAALQAYAVFLHDTSRFERALQRVLAEWPLACEHFLSNESINRIAWLGQASMCIDTGIPACFRGGFKLLDNNARDIANRTAQIFLDRWIRGREKQGAPVRQRLEKARIPTRYPRRGSGRAYASGFSSVLQGDLFRHP